MDELGLFTAALGLSGPWRVTRSEFDVERSQLDLYLEFDRGARFVCPAKEAYAKRSLKKWSARTVWKAVL
jgi:hypothetical protein